MSLVVHNVDAAYDGAQVLRSVCLDAAKAELIGVIGPNGAGKSTLLKAIAGLTQRTGSISVDAQCIDRLPVQQLARLVGYCSQSSFPAWPITVREVVTLGRLPHRDDPEARRHDAAAVDSALERMALRELADRRIDTLSGGERSRALLARTLATEARVLLVDEPTADLDPYHELKAMEALRDESRRGITVIAVLHNLTLAARFCDRLAVIDNGVIRATGEPATVLSQSLLRSVYAVDAHIDTHDGSSIVIPWRRLHSSD